MKLTLNAQELLALYDLLEATRPRLAIETDQGSPDFQLHQLQKRIRLCIIAALRAHGTDPVDAFLAREQAKIDGLIGQPIDVKGHATSNVFTNLDDEAQESISDKSQDRNDPSFHPCFR